MSGKVKAQAAVIPHIESEPQVQHASEQKLRRRYDGAADKRRADRIRSHFQIYAVHNKKAKSADKKHRRVRMPSPQSFDCSVHRTAERKRRCIFNCTFQFQKITPDIIIDVGGLIYSLLFRCSIAFFKLCFFGAYESVDRVNCFVNVCAVMNGHFENDRAVIAANNDRAIFELNLLEAFALGDVELT